MGVELISQPKGRTQNTGDRLGVVTEMKIQVAIFWLVTP
jgi:hypothetical protein